MVDVPLESAILGSLPPATKLNIVEVGWSRVAQSDVSRFKFELRVRVVASQGRTGWYLPASARPGRRRSNARSGCRSSRTAGSRSCATSSI